MAGRTKGPRYYTTTKSPQDFITEIFGLLSAFGARSFHVSTEGVVRLDGGVAQVFSPPEDPLPWQKGGAWDDGVGV